MKKIRKRKHSCDACIATYGHMHNMHHHHVILTKYDVNSSIPRVDA